MRTLVALLVAFCLAGEPAAAPPPRVAVLPALDLSGGKAPLEEVDRLVSSFLAHRRAAVLPAEAVSAFLDARRIRYLGGLVPEDMAALRSQLQADVVVVVVAELYEAEPPPRVGLAAMAFSCADGAPLGAAEVVLAGEERPGFLGMAEVSDPAVLLERAALELTAQISKGDLQPAASWEHPRPRRSLRPDVTSRLPDLPLPERRPWRVAVLPFENRSELTSAGEVVAGQVLRALSGRPGFLPLDPGTLRASLLEHRVIQDWGLSLAQADALRVALDPDFLVTGRVLHFTDRGPDMPPQVAFSLRVLDVRSRHALWSSYGDVRGDEGVVAFDIGRYRCAHALSRDMAEAAVGAFLQDLERKAR